MEIVVTAHIFSIFEVFVKGISRQHYYISTEGRGVEIETPNNENINRSIDFTPISSIMLSAFAPYRIFINDTSRKAR